MMEDRDCDCISSPVVTTTPESGMDDCCKTMEANQIRRVPVVDGYGGYCALLSPADIARHKGHEETGEVVQEVSKPNSTATGVSR